MRRTTGSVTRILGVLVAWWAAAAGGCGGDPGPEATAEEACVAGKAAAPRGEVFSSARYQNATAVLSAGWGEVTPGASSLAAACDTAGPYRPGITGFSCTFAAPHDGGISLHFKDFDTERNYDTVSVHDGAGTLVALYHGALGSFWTDVVPGRTATLRFGSDGCIAGRGFSVDRYYYGGKPAVPAPPQPGWREVAVHYATEHGVTVGPGRTYTDTFVIRRPGATAMRLHFARLSLDRACLKSACQVWLRVLGVDAAGRETEVVTYSGSTHRTDFWQAQEVAGDTVKLRYEIRTAPVVGGVVGEYGFAIDRLAVKGVDRPSPFENRYPLVLHHGAGGFDQVAGVAYYFRVKGHLERHGYEVHTTEVTASGTLATRAGQLAKQVDQVLAHSSRRRGVTVDRVSLVGHSMGGLDARLLVSDNTAGSSTSSDPRDAIKGLGYGAKVAALTTVATPHHGSRLADVALGLLPGAAQKVADALISALSGLYNRTAPDRNEAMKMAYYLTERFCAQLGKDHPEPTSKGITYRTYAGVTHPMLPKKPNADEVDPQLAATRALLIALSPQSKQDNDGMVPLWSARWRDAYYKTYQGAPLLADHYNQVGQILGLTDEDFDHRAFFLHIAKEMP